MNCCLLTTINYYNILMYAYYSYTDGKMNGNSKQCLFFSTTNIDTVGIEYWLRIVLIVYVVATGLHLASHCTFVDNIIVYYLESCLSDY